MVVMHAMPARRTRPTVTSPTEIIDTLFRIPAPGFPRVWKVAVDNTRRVNLVHILGQSTRLNIIRHPMHPRTTRRIRVIHNQRKALRFGRCALPIQLGRRIFSLTRMFGWYGLVVPKTRAAQCESCHGLFSPQSTPSASFGCKSVENPYIPRSIRNDLDMDRGLPTEAGAPTVACSGQSALNDVRAANGRSNNKFRATALRLMRVAVFVCPDA